MGLIESLNVPYDGKKNVEFKTNNAIVSKLIDDIILEFASLIADIEDRKVNESVLTKEIEKRVSSQKGIYEPAVIVKLIFDTIYGYGILQPLIIDSKISDIDIPRYDCIYIKREGVTEKSEIHFDSEDEFERFSKLLIIRHGGIINEVDSHCRVSDKDNHLRINVCIPPRNVSGTSLNIRKHLTQSFSFGELINLEFITEDVSNVLKKLNLVQSNILICGKGAAGKTTLLRTLIDTGDEFERVLICETDTELYPHKKNTIVQSIKKNEHGGKILKLSDLIREGLTMSLDTYCIGEIVGSEAWDFVKAGFTDHRIIGTIHASSSRDALDRILMLIENESQIGQNQLKQIISKSIHYVIYVKQFKVREIIGVKGFDVNNGQFLSELIYSYSS